MGTIIGTRHDGRMGEVWEAKVKWDRAGVNVYRTGRGNFDLQYAPGETWETPVAAAKRLKLPEVVAMTCAQQ